jgi:hypothetical protein
MWACLRGILVGERGDVETGRDMLPARIKVSSGQEVSPCPGVKNGGLIEIARPALF